MENNASAPAALGVPLPASEVTNAPFAADESRSASSRSRRLSPIDEGRTEQDTAKSEPESEWNCEVHEAPGPAAQLSTTPAPGTTDLAAAIGAVVPIKAEAAAQEVPAAPSRSAAPASSSVPSPASHPAPAAAAAAAPATALAPAQVTAVAPAAALAPAPAAISQPVPAPPTTVACKAAREVLDVQEAASGAVTATKATPMALAIKATPIALGETARSIARSNEVAEPPAGTEGAASARMTSPRLKSPLIEAPALQSAAARDLAQEEPATLVEDTPRTPEQPLTVSRASDVDLQGDVAQMAAAKALALRRLGIYDDYEGPSTPDKTVSERIWDVSPGVAHLWATEGERIKSSQLLAQEAKRRAALDVLRRRVAVCPAYCMPSAPRETAFHNVRDVTRGQDAARNRSPLPCRREPLVPEAGAGGGTNLAKMSRAVFTNVRDVTRGHADALRRSQVPRGIARGGADGRMVVVGTVLQDIQGRAPLSGSGERDVRQTV